MRLERRVHRLESALAPPPPSTCASCGHPLPPSLPVAAGSQTLRILPPRVARRIGERLAEPDRHPDPCGVCGLAPVVLRIRVPRPGRAVGATE